MDATLRPLERRIRVDDGVGLLVMEHRPPRPHPLLPVVFVPGWGSHRSGWTDLVATLARSTTVFHVEGRDKLEVRHLAHLLPVVVVGLVLALVGTHVRLGLGFLPALLLGALAVAGLVRAVAYLMLDEG